MQQGSSPTSLLSILLESELFRWLITELVQLWKEHRFDGTYTVDDHTSTLELCDSRGCRAIYTKRQTMTFIQNGVFAIQDQAWGDGDIFADYVCTPGVLVDRYKEGYRWKLLISLRATMNKSEKQDVFIERTILNGFLTSISHFQTQVDHPTKSLTLTVVFPKRRHPKKITLIEQNMQRMHVLRSEKSTLLSHGRIQYSWHVTRPRLFESYILRWEW